MAGTITVSAAASPFPWGPVAIATFTQKAELVFDQGASGVTLVLDGTTTTDEQEIVRALAKAGGLSDESVKVSFSLCKDRRPRTNWSSADSNVLCPRELDPEAYCVPRHNRCP